MITTAEATATEAITFGIELEFTGISMKDAAELVKAYFHSDKRISMTGMSAKARKAHESYSGSLQSALTRTEKGKSQQSSSGHSQCFMRVRLREFRITSHQK